MAGARAAPRRPAWLEATPPPSIQEAREVPRAADATARVLEFPPATRPPTASASRAAAAALPRTTPLPPTAARPSTAAPPGSALAPVPAYRSALARLAHRPTTAPTPASAAPLPSSRLDALLSARHGSAAPSPAPAAAVASAAAKPPASAAALHLPSSRLDELLARPALLASATSGKPSTGGLPTRGSQGQAAARAPPLPAARPALSPVEEEAAAPLRTRSPGSSTAAGLAASPSAAAQPAAAAVPAAPAGQVAIKAAAALPPAGLHGDPGLQDRLRERIEQAKEQIRQQLSPMFKLSQALLGAKHDPQRAADALDAATGAAGNGFERLARRPGSRGGDAAAAPAPAGGASGAVLSLPAPVSQPAAAGQSAGRAAQAPQQEQQQGAARAGDRERRPYDVQPGGASTAEEADSLVANARAAAARAQSALADLASPPRHAAASATRQHQQWPPGGAASPRRAAVASPGAASSAPRPAAPLPYAQLTISAADGAASSLALPTQHPAEVQAGVGHLRQHSEALIRSECERMVASMHSLLDGFLAGLSQPQPAQEPAPQRPVEPQRHQHHQQALEQQQQQHSMVQPAAHSGDSASLAAEGAGSECQAGDAAHADGSGSSSGGGDGSVGWTSAADQQEAGTADAWEEEEEAGAHGSEAAPLSVQDQLQQHDGAWLVASAHAGDGAQAGEQSPPERQRGLAAVAAAAGGGGSFQAGFAGFGSPIRLHLSPAKLGAAGWQQAGAQQQQRQLGSAVRSLSLRGGLLAATASEQVTPAFGAPQGARPAVFHTARSFAPPPSCGSNGSRDIFDSPAPASLGSSGRDVAAPGGAAGPARGGAALLTPPPALLGGAGRMDLDSIVGSIKRLAAEMRLKQGALAAPLAAPAAPPQQQQQLRGSPVAARLLSPAGSGSSSLPSAASGKPPR